MTDDEYIEWRGYRRDEEGDMRADPIHDAQGTDTTSPCVWVLDCHSVESLSDPTSALFQWIQPQPGEVLPRWGVTTTYRGLGCDPPGRERWVLLDDIRAVEAFLAMHGLSIAKRS